MSDLVKENLLINYRLINGPYYALNLNRIIRNYKSFKEAFQGIYPKIEIGYSYKTNYTKDVIRCVSELGAFSEIVSKLEFQISQSINIPIDKIIYNGPLKDYKTMRTILINGGIVHLDCLKDFEYLKKILNESKIEKVARIGLRFNLALNENSSRFGFDILGTDYLQIIKYVENSDRVILDAVHIHYPDRDLNSFDFRVKTFFEFISASFKKIPKIVNLGSGFYSESVVNSSQPNKTDFKDYARILKKHISLLSNKFDDDFTLFFEPGTPLVVDAMDLIGKIYNIKNISGKYIATSDLSIFDFNPRSFPKSNEIVTFNYSGNPLNYKDLMIAGNTCVEKDILMESYSGYMEEDCLMLVKNVGSYSNVMKPPFIFESLPIIVVDDYYKKIKISKKLKRTSEIINEYL